MTKYPNNVECIWYIDVQHNYHINVSFYGRFEIESDPDCSKDYLIVWVFLVLIDEKYWMQVGEETAVVNVDFFVDNFDRNDSNNLGDNWENSTSFSIVNGNYIWSNTKDNDNIFNPKFYVSWVEFL